MWPLKDPLYSGSYIHRLISESFFLELFFFPITPTLGKDLFLSYLSQNSSPSCYHPGPPKMPCIVSLFCVTPHRIAFNSPHLHFRPSSSWWDLYLIHPDWTRLCLIDIELISTVCLLLTLSLISCPIHIISPFRSLLNCYFFMMYHLLILADNGHLW